MFLCQFPTQEEVKNRKKRGKAITTQLKIYMKSAKAISKCQMKLFCAKK